MLLVGNLQKDQGKGHGARRDDFFQGKDPALVPKKVFRFVFFLGNEGRTAGNDQARFFQERFGLVPAGVLQGTVPEFAHGNNVVLVLAEDQNASNKGVLCKDGSSRFWLVGTRLKTP